MKLVRINGEPVPVAAFTVIDIGLPYQKIEPTYFYVNYPKEAASHICGYLVEGKEVLVYGIMRQKHSKDADGRKTSSYYLRAEMVELLPVFSPQGGGGGDEGESVLAEKIIGAMEEKMKRFKSYQHQKILLGGSTVADGDFIIDGELTVRIRDGRKGDNPSCGK